MDKILNLDSVDYNKLYGLENPKSACQCHRFE